jgi:hypothetical protein
MVDILKGMTVDELVQYRNALREAYGDPKDKPISTCCKSHWLFGIWQPTYAAYRADGKYRA